VTAALVVGFFAWAQRLEAPLPESTRVDFVVVEKSARRMALFRKGRKIKVYEIALGGDPVGAKVRHGDQRTPEGSYRIDRHQYGGRYDFALHVSYPKAEDTERAKAMGAEPGGDVMIHGLKRGLGWLGRLHRLRDWTDGSIAVTDAEMNEIWRVVPDGTFLEIRP
jgi:murein L,D-transpeptidase YafK